MSDAYGDTLDLGTCKLHRVDAAGLNTLIKDAWEEGLSSGPRERPRGRRLVRRLDGPAGLRACARMDRAPAAPPAP
jgi:hypothetical protein